MISLLTYLRIKESIGEVHHIPILEGHDVTRFLAGREKAIIIFHDGFTKYDFANFAVYKYRDDVSFGVAKIEEGKKWGVKGPIQIIPFLNSEVVSAPKAPLRPIAFTNWVANAFSKRTIVIHHPEELRRIFSRSETCVFGVDGVERPEKLRENVTFYSVPSSYFVYFNLSLQAGVYVYRSADRQLVRPSVANNNPNPYLTTHVSDLNSENLELKPYFGGYFMDRTNTTLCQKEIEVLTKLSSAHSDKFNFGPIFGELDDVLSERFSLNYLKRPFFAVFDENGRWVLPFDKSHNFRELHQLIDGIENGTLAKKFISQKSEELTSNIKSISYDSFDTDTNSTKDVVLLISQPLTSSGRRFNAIYKRVADMIAPIADHIIFEYLDVSTNDLPFDLGMDSVPVLMMWPKEKPVIIYDNDVSFQPVVSFVSFESTQTVNVPEFNTTKIDNEIRFEVYPELLKYQKSMNRTNVQDGSNFTENNQTKEIKGDITQEL